MYLVVANPINQRNISCGVRTRWKCRNDDAADEHSDIILVHGVRASAEQIFLAVLQWLFSRFYRQTRNWGWP